MKIIKDYFPAVATVVIGLIAWRELAPLYARARAAVGSKMPARSAE